MSLAVVVAPITDVSGWRSSPRRPRQASVARRTWRCCGDRGLRAEHVFRQPTPNGDVTVVVWAARLDGPTAARLLIAGRSGTANERDQVDRLEAMLSAEGLECVQLRVDRVMEIAELARYAATVTRRPPAPELPAARRRS
jgi:hypothetical protein